MLAILASFLFAVAGNSGAASIFPPHATPDELLFRVFCALNGAALMFWGIFALARRDD